MELPTSMDAMLLPLALVEFILGIIFLYKGSDVLVDGTSKAAAQLGISSLIISVVLVGFGTSAPEFAISVGAAATNNPDISLGNILGSCIANILLVLGLAAVIRPIQVHQGIIKREAPIVLLATLILVGASFVGLLDQYHLIGGILFIIFFALFLYYFVRCARQERIKGIIYEKNDMKKNLLFIILGIAGVVFGAWLLIQSAVSLATLFDIAPIFIGLTLVAVGTSLPELVVSVVASYKKESDIAVGNVLGSNVFNILLILGVAAVFLPLGAMAELDLSLILVAVTLLIFPLIYTKKIISRWEGAFLLILYAIFILYISPVW